MMIECLIGGSAIAAYMWSRTDKFTDNLINELERIRDMIEQCGRREDSYHIHQTLITRDLQSLQGKIPHDDKLYEMLTVLQKEWKEVQDRHRRIQDREIDASNSVQNRYYI